MKESKKTTKKPTKKTTKKTPKKTTKKTTKKPTKKTPRTPETWNKIRGVMRIYPHEFKDRVMFSTSISFKDMDEEYHNIYYNVRFRTNDEPQYTNKEPFYICINDAFLTGSYNEKNGEIYHNIMILEYEQDEVDEDEEDEDEDEEEELPF